MAVASAAAGMTALLGSVTDEASHAPPRPVKRGCSGLR
jgi:hypothetical protein